MIQYFEDYRWSDRVPVGINELRQPEAGKPYCKFITCVDGICVERYDGEGGFAGLCHDPDDNRFDRDWKKERSADGTSAVVQDADGRVVRYETYTFLDEKCAGTSLVHARIFNADGRLLEVHEPREVSDTAYDIHVTDALGKLKCVLHHSGVDKGEPYTIAEEWVV